MEVTSQTAAIGVAEYSARIGRALRAVGGAVVEGEVQKPKLSAGGMLFFDLTDGEACLPCKVFSRQVRGLRHEPAHGDLVEVTVDRPDFWQQRGSLSLIVSDVRLTGEGELLRRREELLRKLREEGLCDPDRRKPLPGFPRAVGVIAGRGSDGMSDVLRALEDRFPPVHVVTCAATVQGKAAPRDLIDALVRLQSHPLVDVIIVARGGGSVQDLVAFDDERLCRAMFACEKPIVAAIGHTDNAPVCNHVTWAAYTPSRSAELVVPSAAEMRHVIGGAERGLGAVPDGLRRSLETVAEAERGLAVGRTLDARAAAVAGTAGTMERAKQAFFHARERGLAAAQLVLASLPRRLPSPAQVTAVDAALDTRAQAFFGERAGVVAFETRRLAACEQAVGRAATNVGELGRRLEVGIRRQLADHTRDYGHALARLVRETHVGAARRIAVVRRHVEHLGDVVAAHDFRRRGWIVATGEHDDAVSTVSELDAGSRLRLTFSDGQAHAVVDEIFRDRKETR
jgi:exodeoxyribonuclease VII large subunit